MFDLTAGVCVARRIAEPAVFNLNDMAQRKNEHGLTPKEEAFCHAYVNAYGTPDFGNATEAVVKTYNYTRRDNAAKKASELMNRYQISTRIADLLNERIAIAGVDSQSQLERDNLMSNFDDGLLWETDEETGRDMKIQISKLPKWIRVLGTWKTVGGRAIFAIDKEAARNRLSKLTKQVVEVQERKFEDIVPIDDL